MAHWYYNKIMMCECSLCDIAMTSLWFITLKKNLITLIGNLVDKASIFVGKNNDVE